jgi:hypothetical protein
LGTVLMAEIRSLMVGVAYSISCAGATRSYGGFVDDAVLNRSLTCNLSPSVHFKPSISIELIA